MKRRILAWILLVGFLLLLLNLIVIKYQWYMSIMAYFMIMLIFVFTNKKRTDYNDDTDVESNNTNDDDTGAENNNTDPENTSPDDKK